jgi:uncharacterized protein YabE (DUF348 family)
MRIKRKPTTSPNTAKPGSLQGWKRLWQRLGSMHWSVIPALTFVFLLTLTLVGYALFTHNRVRATDSLVVIVSHDDVEQTVPTTQTTVGELLKKLDISLRQGDVVEPASNVEIKQDDFRINVYRSKPVEVIDNGQRNFTFSAATTPRSIAKQAGATLYPEDKLVTEPVTEFLKDRTLGTKVLVARATPITLNLYGEPVAIRTQAKTVGELLKERDVKLGKDDSVSPAANSPLTANSQVFLLRQGTKIASVTEEIPMPLEVIQDASLALGTSAVRQQGSAGQKISTYQLNLQNDKEIGRSLLQEVVTKTPVKQVVVQGTSLSGIKGNMAMAGISPGDYQYVDYIISRESGWCPTKAQGQYGACRPLVGAVPTYGGYGLCQSTPPQKMASAGADWATNPVTQLKWCHGYAMARYGSWGAAYNHWLTSHNW